ncbi:hypothetical protein C8R45DRAFT_1186671 [Mycena sanguinolenta]|nr:hypothetical protein C8R45DRAFT_1186671 [Mycena sanguinolenta]
MLGAMKLRAEQAHVRERLDNYKYPVLTLPNVITSEIFIHFLPVYPEAPPLTGLASTTTLTHVANGERTMAMAAKRWEHLRLWIRSHSHPKIGPIPRLCSQTLAFDPTDKVYTYDAPQLRTVFLLGCIVPHVVLPWAQLTCLTLDGVAIDPSISVLQQTTNLVQCDPLLSSLKEPARFVGSYLILHRMESLILEDYGRAVDGYLASFVVPALRRLHLQEICLSVDPIPALEMFIAKSGCKLQEVLFAGILKLRANSILHSTSTFGLDCHLLLLLIWTRLVVVMRARAQLRRRGRPHSASCHIQRHQYSARQQSPLLYVSDASWPPPLTASPSWTSTVTVAVQTVELEPEIGTSARPATAEFSFSS